MAVILLHRADQPGDQVGVKPQVGEAIEQGVDRDLSSRRANMLADDAARSTTQWPMSA